MHVRVLFFGMLRDIVGMSREEVEFPEGADLHSVFASYASRFPRLGDLARSIVVARNQEFAHPAAKLADGDEVAFLPPVSGGCDTDRKSTRVKSSHLGISYAVFCLKKEKEGRVCVLCYLRPCGPARGVCARWVG